MFQDDWLYVIQIISRVTIDLLYYYVFVHNVSIILNYDKHYEM